MGDMEMMRGKNSHSQGQHRLVGPPIGDIEKHIHIHKQIIDQLTAKSYKFF
jgi:hypothetical protein